MQHTTETAEVRTKHGPDDWAQKNRERNARLWSVDGRLHSSQGSFQLGVRLSSFLCWKNKSEKGGGCAAETRNKDKKTKPKACSEKESVVFLVGTFFLYSPLPRPPVWRATNGSTLMALATEEGERSHFLFSSFLLNQQGGIVRRRRKKGIVHVFLLLNSVVRVAGYETATAVSTSLRLKYGSNTL